MADWVPDEAIPALRLRGASVTKNGAARGEDLGRAAGRVAAARDLLGEPRTGWVKPDPRNGPLVRGYLLTPFPISTERLAERIQANGPSSSGICRGGAECAFAFAVRRRTGDFFQWTPPSAVGIRVHRERLGRELEVHHEGLEVDPRVGPFTAGRRRRRAGQASPAWPSTWRPARPCPSPRTAGPPARPPRATGTDRARRFSPGVPSTLRSRARSAARPRVAALTQERTHNRLMAS